jgi:hypothetical protein
MKVVELTAHPGNADPAPDRIVVETDWSATTRRLALRYRFLGRVGRTRLPGPVPPGRADGLWRRSCCEAFIGRTGASGYWEFNFSPSGEWAAYSFSGRRSGMSPLGGLDAPAIRLSRGGDEVVLEAGLDLSPRLPAGPAQLLLGLAVVVQDDQDRRSFWALRHAPGQPDFHDPSSFLLHLEMPPAQPSQEPSP